MEAVKEVRQKKKKKMMGLNEMCLQKYSSQQERRGKQRRMRERKESER